MIKILRKIVIVFMFLSAATAAADVDKFCKEHGDTAELIMKVRQQGVPISRLLEGISSDSIFRDMAFQAYEQPRMSHEENQQRVIEDFRNDQELLCLKALQKRRKK